MSHKGKHLRGGMFGNGGGTVVFCCEVGGAAGCAAGGTGGTGAAGAAPPTPAAACGAGVGSGAGARSTLRRHVGQVCCLWNHKRRHAAWKM